MQVLRTFRDEHLLTNAPGRAFVAFYDEYSPPIAKIIAGNGPLRAAARTALIPVIVAINYPAGAGLAVMLLVCGVLTRLHKKRFQRMKSASEILSRRGYYETG